MTEPNRIVAQFVPDDGTILAETLFALALVDNPRLASALARSYPILVLVDELVLFLTWTNANLYSNTLAVVLFSLSVRYWFIVSHTGLPLTLALMFSWLVFHAQYSKEAPATLDDVLRTLYNLSVRVDIIMKPLSRLESVVSTLAIYWTPVYIVMTTSIVSPRFILWFVGCFVLTVFLPWAHVFYKLALKSAWCHTNANSPSTKRPITKRPLDVNALRKVPPKRDISRKVEKESSIIAQEKKRSVEVKGSVSDAPATCLTPIAVQTESETPLQKENDALPGPDFEHIPIPKNTDGTATGFARRNLPPPFKAASANSSGAVAPCYPASESRNRKPGPALNTDSTTKTTLPGNPIRRKMAPPPEAYNNS